ncbi:hypothetical protein CK203_103766 [Vitis vinifera]|uniref:Uncharacterized protein n=1 Tax=Vitis vinifera TaxID=29760 RepID=A0A438CI04_VITVI|nr:hypothetical protein CK203_103766 [Vitis vinifera]
MAILLHQDPGICVKLMMMLFGCGNSSELNLQVEAERSYHQTVLATLEKLFDEVCNYTSCFVFILRQIIITKIMTGILSPHVLLLELDDYGEETKRVFISANNYGERCLRSYTSKDLTIMDMQIKMVHTLLQK